MKKFTIGAVALIVVGAFVFMGCPDTASVPGPQTGTNCMSPTNGEAVAVDLIYGDARYDRCKLLDTWGTFGAYVRPGKVGTDLAFVEMDGGESTGENVCGKGYALSLVTATALGGGGFITLEEDYDVSGKKLYFSVRSPVTGGATSMRVYLEAQAPDGTSDGQVAANYRTATDEGVVDVTNDGEWELLMINIDTEFAFSAANITASTIRSIGFALMDQNGTILVGLGVQTISIDEIRFEE